MAPESKSPESDIPTTDPKLRFWWRFLERFGISMLVNVALAAAFWYWSYDTREAHKQNNAVREATMMRAWERVGKLTERVHQIEKALLLVHPKEGRKVLEENDE